MPTSGSPIPNGTVIHAPSFGGGRLNLFNRLLRALAICSSKEGENTEFRLVLDDNLTAAADLRLPIQNVNGDVVHVDIPDHGKLGCGSRAGLTAALLDSLPPGPCVEEVVDFVLPEPLQTPLEAAAEMWSRIFPQLRVECIPRGAGSLIGTKRDALEPTGITWFSARHQTAIQELGLSMDLVLQGEAACRSTLVSIPAGELGKSVRRCIELVEQQLAELKPVAKEVDSKLIGSWARLRRDWRSAINEFSDRADRAGRNRVGIRNSRVHSLAQALCPNDLAQEQGLSFLTAIGSFQLNYQDISGYLTRLSDCAARESVQIHT